MASVWVAVRWGEGVALCTRPLRASVAGWAGASAWRLTPAISVEFGLYSCVWLDRNKELPCTRGFGIQRSGEQEAAPQIHPHLRWRSASQMPRMEQRCIPVRQSRVKFSLLFALFNLHVSNYSIRTEVFKPCYFFCQHCVVGRLFFSRDSSWEVMGGWSHTLGRPGRKPVWCCKDLDAGVNIIFQQGNNLKYTTWVTTEWLKSKHFHDSSVKVHDPNSIYYIFTHYEA